MSLIYDTIGINYAELRKPDPRIAAMIHAALGSARTVLNVGAGTGSYEPADKDVTAVDPSLEMIRQRRTYAASVIQGRAEELPFADRSFDAAMAVLTVHHWSDQGQGLRELRRVTRGPVVILTYDPAFKHFWLGDYIPELIVLDEAQMPTIDMYEHCLGPVTIAPVPIPHDCTDGFLCAYWRRPEAYLDKRVRSAISSFWKVGDVSVGMERLARELRTGEWRERYGDLLTVDALDLGYRLVVGR
jgi:SAM-dependent methyltransferase